MRKDVATHTLLSLTVFLMLFVAVRANAAPEEIMDLGAEQAQEKLDLHEMKRQIKEVSSTVNQSMQTLGLVGAELNSQKVKEFHLVAKETTWEILPGILVHALTYNGQTPGPSIRVSEGDLVQVVLHNKLKVPTSLHFHGLILPGSVDGVPRHGKGLVGPGETFVYQFVASQSGTFWYHPQVMHTQQQTKGLCGALIVEPSSAPKSYEKDYVVILGQFLVAPRIAVAGASPPKVILRDKAHSGKALPAVIAEVVSPLATPWPKELITYFTVNGKSAPSIPAIELYKGQRIRLRVINAAQQVCPLHITGHKFEVVGINGGDALEPHISRDSLAVEPGDRVDLEFSGDNPGTWSLSSGLVSQTTTNGKFPGGIACVLRYLR